MATQPQIPRNERKGHLDFYEFSSFHHAEIKKHLRKIDRARENLIKAQNELALWLGTTQNDYTLATWEEFYALGGVTADQWQGVNQSDNYAPPETRLKARNQLRVVK